MMESWRKVWRVAASKQFSDNGLIALRKALLTDDPRLIQGATVSPPPIQCVQDWPPEGGDLFAFAAWQGDGKGTVGECEEQFACACFEIDQLLREPAGCRWLLNWFDETPRDEMRRHLLSEVTLELNRRAELEGFRMAFNSDRIASDMPDPIKADWCDDHGYAATAAILRGV